MGEAVYGVGEGGCGCPDLGPDILGGGAGSQDLRVGEMGNDTVHWEGFGQIPPQGGPQADRETTSKRTGRWMGVSTAEGSDVRGSITGGRYLSLPPKEYSCTVHCNQDYYGPVSGSIVEARVKGDQEVVGSGWILLGGDSDGGLGGGTYRGGGGYVR